MAAICGCAQRKYDFVTPNDGGLFRVCKQCGTAWASTPPGWWRRVGDDEPPGWEDPEPTDDGGLPQEYRR